MYINLDVGLCEINGLRHRLTDHHESGHIYVFFHWEHNARVLFCYFLDGECPGGGKNHTGFGWSCPNFA